MRNRVSVVLLICFALTLLAIGEVIGGKYSKESLIGTWEVDMLAMMKASGQLPPGMDPAQMVRGSSMTVTFRKDGTVLFAMKSLMGEQTEEAKWEVIKSEGNALVVKSTDKEGEVQKITCTFKNPDQFTATSEDPEENPTMELTRVTGNVKKSARANRSDRAESKRKTASKAKRYEIEKACIKYKYTGMLKGTETVYFRDWGNDELTIKDVVLAIAGTEQRTHTASYTKRDKIYTVDLETDEGSVIDSPNFPGGMSEEQAKRFGEAIRKQFGDEVASEEVLGRKCRVFVMPDLDSKTWSWMNIVLRSITGTGDFGQKKVAVEITFDFDEKILELPKNINWEKTHE